MPSAMSRPSEPVETVSTSIDLLFLPNRMIEPLPKLRSIWDSAASRAFDLSMEEPSTRRSAAVAIAPTPYDRDSGDRQRTVRVRKQCTLFVLCSQYVLFTTIFHLIYLLNRPAIRWGLSKSPLHRPPPYRPFCDCQHGGRSSGPSCCPS